MKTLIFLLFSFGLYANQAELLQAVLLESATSPHSKKVVEMYYAKLEAQKALEIARLQEGGKVARGGKTLYSKTFTDKVQKQIEILSN